MWRIIRRIGIAIGSVTIAFLALGLVGGVIGLSPGTGFLWTIAVLGLGGLVYLDITRREIGADGADSTHAP